MKFHSCGNLGLVFLLVSGTSLLAAEPASGYEVESGVTPLPNLAAGDPNQPQLSDLDPNTPREKVVEAEVAVQDPNAPAEVVKQTASSPPKAPAPAPQKSQPVEKKKQKAEVMDMAAVIALVQQQQAQLAKQEKVLADQALQLENLRDELDALRAPPITKEVEEQIGVVEQDSQPIDIKVPSEEQVVGTDTVDEASKEFQKTRDEKTSEAVALLR